MKRAWVNGTALNIIDPTSGDSLLHCAVRGAQPGIMIDLLLTANENGEFLHHVNFDGASVLDIATELKLTSIYNRLLEHIEKLSGVAGGLGKERNSWRSEKRDGRFGSYDNAANLWEDKTLSAVLHACMQSMPSSDWTRAEAFVPVQSGDTIVLVQHSCMQFHDHGVENNNEVSLERQRFQNLRTLLAVESGHSMVGRIFASRLPEWEDLHTLTQSQYVTLPNAKRAGYATVVGMPVLYQGNVLAVILWYSSSVMEKKATSLTFLLGIFKIATFLARLQAGTSKRVPPASYCQSLQSALTGGVVEDSAIEAEPRRCSFKKMKRKKSQELN